MIGQCPNGFRCILGDGPTPCKYMAMAEAPGKMEHYKGVPLVGDTGREWNETYLPLAGLKRANVYATNVVKHRPDLNRKPTAREIDQCVNCPMCSLQAELQRVQPEIVFIMGATACSIIPDIDLECEHGVPRWCADLHGWSGWVVPMYHPAVGLHETGMMTVLLDDWAGLREWPSSGVWGWPIDSSIHDYGLVKRRTDLDHYFTDCISFSNPPYPICGMDTESHGGVPYSIQFSLAPGTSRMILLEDRGLVDYWSLWAARQITRYGMELVFHNAPADLDVIYSLGVRRFKYRDTMQDAYHMGNQPQGLKALSYRLLGRRRKSWEETVTGPSKLVLCDWLNRSIEYAARNWTQTVERRSAKTGKLLKPKLAVSEAGRTLESILTHTIASESYDPWDKLSERLMCRDEDWFYADQLIHSLGPVPVKGIAHCSEADQIEYACSDADDCLAIAMLLDRMRDEVGAEIQEEDYDVRSE